MDWYEMLMRQLVRQQTTRGINQCGAVNGRHLVKLERARWQHLANGMRFTFGLGRALDRLFPGVDKRLFNRIPNVMGLEGCVIDLTQYLLKIYWFVLHHNRSGR